MNMAAETIHRCILFAAWNKTANQHPTVAVYRCDLVTLTCITLCSASNSCLTTVSNKIMFVIVPVTTFHLD